GSWPYRRKKYDTTTGGWSPNLFGSLVGAATRPKWKRLVGRNPELKHAVVAGPQVEVSLFGRATDLREIARSGFVTGCNDDRPARIIRATQNHARFSPRARTARPIHVDVPSLVRDWKEGWVSDPGAIERASF